MGTALDRQTGPYQLQLKLVPRPGKGVQGEVIARFELARAMLSRLCWAPLIPSSHHHTRSGRHWSFSECYQTHFSGAARR
jgi:hypothetical protein